MESVKVIAVGELGVVELDPGRVGEPGVVAEGAVSFGTGRKAAGVVEEGRSGAAGAWDAGFGERARVFMCSWARVNQRL